MSYEPEVLRRAYQRMKEGQRLRAEAFASKKAMIYHQLPRVQAIDRQLRQGVVQAATAALKQGVDPAPAIQALRAESKALQAERKDLLTQAGYREEDLVEQPQCQQCRDTGWCGSTMCVCLRALCAEEQVRSLSSLLDLQGQSFDAFRLDYYPDDPGPNGVSPPLPHEAGPGHLPGLCRPIRVQRREKPVPLRKPRPGQDLPPPPASPEWCRNGGTRWSTTPPSTSLAALRRRSSAGRERLHPALPQM